MSLSYNQIIQLNRDWAEVHPIIKNFGVGDAWDIVRHNQELDYKYPLLWLEDVPVTNREKEFSYSFRIWFIQSVPEIIDRGTDLMYQNENDAKSDMIECAKDFVSFWENNTAYPELRLEKGFTYETFTDKLEDRVTGCYLNFTVTVPFPYSTCDTPFISIFCEPVQIFRDGILIETVESGGSFSYLSTNLTINSEVYQNNVEGDLNIPVIDSNLTEGGNVSGLNFIIPDHEIEVNGSSYGFTPAFSVTNVEVVDEADNPIGSLNGVGKWEVIPVCDDVNTEFNLSPTTETPSGGTIDFQVRDSNNNFIGTLNIDTATDKQVGVADSSLTINGSSITGVLAEGSKTIQIVDQNDNNLLISTVTDNSSTYKGEVTVLSPTITPNRETLTQTVGVLTYDEKWHIDNGTFDINYPTTPQIQQTDPADSEKILFDDSEFTSISQHLFRFVGASGGYYDPSDGNYYDINGTLSDRNTEFLLLGSYYIIDRLTWLGWRGVRGGTTDWSSHLSALPASFSGFSDFFIPCVSHYKSVMRTDLNLPLYLSQRPPFDIQINPWSCTAYGGSTSDAWVFISSGNIGFASTSSTRQSAYIRVHNWGIDDNI